MNLNDFLDNKFPKVELKEVDDLPKEESNTISLSNIEKEIGDEEIVIKNSILTSKVNKKGDSINIVIDNNEIQKSIEKQIGDKLAINEFSSDVFNSSSELISVGDISIKLKNPESYVTVSKQDDPYMDYPTGSKPVEAVLQSHYIGRRGHINLRIKHGDFLIGWGVFNQKAGAIENDVETISTAKQITDSFGENEGKYYKSFVTPNRSVVEKKDKHPLIWFDVKNSVFDAGKEGASKNKKGVIIKMEQPKLYLGLQSESLHEYFIIGKNLKGALIFRRVGGESDSRWVVSLEKEISPRVLSKTSVKEGIIPPVGYSGLPDSVENDIPKEFRYWEAKNRQEALKIRDNLVEKKIIDSVSIVDSKFRVTHKKNFLGINTKKAIDTSNKNTNLVDFKILKQVFQNPFGTKGRENWWVLVKDNNKKSMMCWCIKSDIQDLDGVFAEEYKDIDSSIWDLSGTIMPGTYLNQTKNLKSTVHIQDSGNAEVIYGDNSEWMHLDLRGSEIKKEVLAVREEEGSSIWNFKNQKYKQVEKSGDFYLFDSDDEETKAMFRPFSAFNPSQPMLCTSDPFVFFDQIPDSGTFVLDWMYTNVKCIVQHLNEDVHLTIYDDSRKTIDYKNSQLGSLYNELVSFGKGIDGYVLEGYLNIKGSYDESQIYRMIYDGSLFENDVTFQILGAMYLDGENLLDAGYLESKNMVHKYYDIKLKEDYRQIFVSPSNVISYNSKDEFSQKFFSVLPENHKYQCVMLKTPDCEYSLAGRGCGICLYFNKKYNGSIISKQKKRGKRKNSQNLCEWVYEIGIPLDEVSKDFNNKIIFNDKRYITIGKSISSQDLEIKDRVCIKVEDIDYDPLSNAIECTNIEILYKDSDKKETVFMELYESIDRSKVVKSLINAIPETFQFERCSKSIDQDDSEERYVLGIVLEPEKIDGQNEVVSAEEIKNACYNFMEFYQELGFYHTESNFDRVRILENYIAPVDFQLNDRKISTGTWLMGIRVVDDESWLKIKSGEINGLSIFGKAKKTTDLKSKDFSKVN